MPQRVRLPLAEVMATTMPLTNDAVCGGRGRSYDARIGGSRRRDRKEKTMLHTRVLDRLEP